MSKTFTRGEDVEYRKNEGVPSGAIFSTPKRFEYLFNLASFTFTDFRRRDKMSKLVTIEMIVRGDIIDNNVLRKFADKLKRQRFLADFTSTIAVPPFLVASEKHYPSLAVLYGTVELENIFEMKNLLDQLASEENLDIISFKQL